MAAQPCRQATSIESCICFPRFPYKIPVSKGKTGPSRFPQASVGSCDVFARVNFGGMQEDEVAKRSWTHHHVVLCVHFGQAGGHAYEQSSLARLEGQESQRTKRRTVHCTRNGTAVEAEGTVLSRHGG